jgi:hypothetical protein
MIKIKDTYRRVAEAWPENDLRGSFSVWKELAAHPDRATILARNPDGPYCAEVGAGAQGKTS